MRLAALTRSQAADDGKSGNYFRARVLALPETSRMQFVQNFVREQVGSILKVSPELVELERPLAELGLELFDVL